MESSMLNIRILLTTLSTCALVASCDSAATGAGGTTVGADTTGSDGTLTGSDGVGTEDAAAGADADPSDAAADAGGEDAAVDAGPNIDDLPCPSNSKYNGKSENDNMEPGNTCIDCHSTEFKAPKYKFAGTVFRNLITQTGCNASGSASSVVPPMTYTVEITDSSTPPKVLTAKTYNPSGNFHISTGAASGFVMPYKARVIDSAGKARKMIKAQTDGDCNSCHTAVGTNDAPGRIVGP